MKRNVFSQLILAALVLPALASAQASGPQLINFDGKLLNPDGTPMAQASIPIKVQIFNPAKNCVLLEEQHTVNTSATDGQFSIQIGAGTRTGNDTGQTMSTVFQNKSAIPSYDAGGCSGSTYTPAAGDQRFLRVTVNSNVLTPDFALASAPFALSAETLQGMAPTDFLQPNAASNVSQSNLNGIFTGSGFSNLSALVAGTSSLYMKAAPTANVSFGGYVLQNVGAPSAATDAVNKTYSDTKVAGLSIDLQDVAPGAGGGKVLAWDQAQNKWVAQTLSATDATKLPLAGGTMTGAINMNGSNITNIGHMTMNPGYTFHLSNLSSAMEGSLGLSGADKGKVWFNSDTNKVRMWDGTSSMDVGGGITALTGDVVASGTGSVAATISNNAVTTPKVFTNPGANRLVATDGTTGATLVPFTCSTPGDVPSWTVSGWTCAAPGAVGAVVNNGNTLGVAMAIGTNDNYNLNFRTNGGNKATIATDGKFGLGVVSPASAFHLLNTDGNTYASSNTFAYPSSPYSTMTVQNDSSIDNSLTQIVMGSRNSSTNLQFSYIGSVAQTGAGQYRPAMVFGTQDSASGYSEKMRLDAQGFLGIGTVTPASRLDVNGGIVSRPSGVSPGQAGQIKFMELAANGTNTLTLAAPDSLASDTILTLPDGAGSPGQVLTTDGAGGLSWSLPASVPGGSHGYVQFNSGGILTGTPTFLWDTTNGRLGVGTGTPTAKLEVAGSDPAVPAVSIKGSAGQSTDILRVTDGGGASLFRVDMNGNAAVTSTSTGASLQVDGGTAGSTVKLRQSSGTAISPTSTSMGASLGGMSFYGYGLSGYQASAAAQIRGVAGENYTDSTGSAFLAFYTRSPGSVSAPPERMRIDPTGNVGIGTSTPAFPLTVVRNGASPGIAQFAGNVTGGNSATVVVENTNATSRSAQILFKGGGSTNAWSLGTDTLGTGQNDFFVYNDAVGAMRFYIDSAGNTGIGTNAPTDKLHVFNTNPSLMKLESTVSAANLMYINSSGQATVKLDTVGGNPSYQIDVGNNGSDVYVSNLGYVGIGNNSPAAPLHVNGAIVSTEVVIPSGNSADMSAANQVVFQSVGGNVITLNNMVFGGQYRVIVQDTTQRMYTFTGCSTSYYNPANANTTVSKQTIYTITYSNLGTCYIDWKSGY